MSKLKVLELFGGIGACSKALERLGIEHEIVDAVEIDKYAVKSFNAIHNTNFEPQDICEWDKNIEVDLIMHGSPCQDFSLAGKQAGGDKDSGTRSSLMYETIRIVKKLKPKYVIWENVKNLLSKKHRHNFDAYLEIMEQLGYTNYYQVLNAKDYGIPQNRERVFTVSILENRNYKFPKGNVCNNEIDMVEIPQKVKVRKYKVDTEKLKSVLREHKNKSNKSIAESLNKPLTLVEHWFRKDACFSIPDADIWFELKKLLNIETNEFDEAITTFEEKDNVYEKSNRFYCDTGLAPTITSSSANEKIIQTFTFPQKQELKLKLKDMLEDEVDEKYYLSDKMINFFYKNEQVQKEKGNGFRFNVTDGNVVAKTITTRADSRMDDNFLKIKEATKKGYKEAYEGDGVNISSRMKYQRGNVQKDSIQTLTTSGGNDRGVVVNKTVCLNSKGGRNGVDGLQPSLKDRIYDSNGIATCCATSNFFMPNYTDGLKIRKLTPKECWRLMGFDDKDFEKVEKVNSNTQLYKQAGNSICVPVLENILKELLK